MASNLDAFLRLLDEKGLRLSRLEARQIEPMCPAVRVATKAGFEGRAECIIPWSTPNPLRREAHMTERDDKRKESEQRLARDWRIRLSRSVVARRKPSRRKSGLSRKELQDAR